MTDEQKTEDKKKPDAGKGEVVEKKPPQDSVTADRPDPTRYGDWEKNGRCIDF